MLYIFAMLDALAHYWPHILAAISLVTGTLGAVHAAMTKEDVRSAIGWVGVIVLSPLVGAAIYLIAGINRIRRASILQHHLIQTETGRPAFEGFHVEPAMIAQTYGNRFSALKTLGDRVTKSRLVAGNAIDLLGTGDEAYAAIRQAIEGAERSILLETYIFDRDPLGRPRATQGPDFGDSVKVPDEIDVQRARRILDAIRKRLGNALSPEIERDYLERLLELR